MARVNVFLKDDLLMQPLIIVFIGHREAIPYIADDCVCLERRDNSPNRHKAIGIFVLELTQQNIVDDREHGRRGADSQCHRQHSDRRE